MSSSLAYNAHSNDGPFDGTGRWAGAERRRNSRVRLHWRVYLASAGFPHPLRATTRDISSEGFYCLLDQTLKPGERIECDIVVPTHNSQDPADVVYLRCHAQVVRVEKIGSGSKYGVACQIEDYRLIHDESTRLVRRETGEPD